MRATRDGRLWPWGAGAVLLAALFLRWPLPAPGWTHYDELAFILLPLGFWGGDLNPHYFNYPTFQFYLDSLLYLVYYLGRDLAGSAETAAQFVAYRFLVDGRDLLALARGLNALMSVATVAATALLGRRLYGSREGLLAGAFLATLPMAVRFGHLAMTDTPAVLWVVMALLFAVRARQDGRVADYLVTGVCTGLAAATKYPAALVAVPVAVALVAGQGAAAAARRSWICAGTAALVFAAATPYVWLDAAGFWAHFSDMARTHLLPAHRGAARDWVANLRYGVGTAGVAAAAAVLAWSAWRRRWQELVVLSGVAVFGGLLAASTSTFLRYALPLAPLVALLLARAASAAWRWHPGLGVAALVVLAGEPVYASLHMRHLLSGADTREQALRWIAERVPRGGRLVEPVSECGRIEVLTPGRVMVRQAHYLRSYGVASLREAYELLSRRSDLPPLYLEGPGGSTSPSPSGAAANGAAAKGAAAEGAAIPEVYLSYRHPLCPEAGQADGTDAPVPPAAAQATFTPGQADAAVWDRQDWLFVPLGGFARVEQTGPRIQVALLPSRRDAVAVDTRTFFVGMSWILDGYEASRLGRWPAALMAYRRVQEVWGRPEEVVGNDVGSKLYRQAGHCLVQLGQRQEAVRLLELAVALAPGKAEAANDLAAACAAAGQLDRAVQLWQDLVVAHPRFAPAYSNLALALARQGKTRQAREYMQTAAQLTGSSSTELLEISEQDR